MRRSTRSSSSIATLAYSTFSTEVGSSPICCTRLFAAAIGLRISCAMVEDSSSMLACFSVCIADLLAPHLALDRRLEVALAQHAGCRRPPCSGRRARCPSPAPAR